MNKRVLVEAVAARTGLAYPAAEEALDAVLGTISTALAEGDKVTIPGFGTFEVRPRAARSGRNPQTGEPITIPASKTPAFKPASGLKHAVLDAR